jgi:hypothetical protein
MTFLKIIEIADGIKLPIPILSGMCNTSSTQTVFHAASALCNVRL